MTATLEALTTASPTWVQCCRCRTFIYGKRFNRDLHVCVECGWHHQISARERISQLFDERSSHAIDVQLSYRYEFDFVDSKPYAQRLAEARKNTGLDDAMLCVHGKIEGHDVIAAIMDFAFMGGSLGSAVGELITMAAELALAHRIPLLIVCASGGARMQEGAISLMQMAKTTQMLSRLDEAGVLTISLITDPTYGGVAASFATATDIVLCEPGARMGFAGPRVIEQTIGRALPERFQTAESLLERGLIDGVITRSGLRSTLGQLLSITEDNPHDGVSQASDPLIRELAQLPERDAWQVVRLARDLGRPTTLDYAGLLLDDFIELHGDRVFGDCPAVVAGLGRLNGLALVLIGHQKGHTVSQSAARHFGMASPAGNRKAARLMTLAGKLGLPVVSLIDTPGAYPGAEAEEHGQAFRIAENLRLMSRLPVPIVAVVIGEGGSGGALALGVADRVLLSANAVYSVISPEGCAAILWRNRAAAPLAAAELGLEARTLLRLGVVDAILPEPEGGAQQDHSVAASLLGDALASTLQELIPLDPAVLLEQRAARFRRFGCWRATPEKADA